MTPAPLQVGQAPSELALKSAGFTPLAFANAVRIGSSRPVYVAGLLRREPLMAPWSIDTTPSRPATDPSMSELLPDPATPVSTTSTPSGMSTSTSWRLLVLAPRTSSRPGRRPDRRLHRRAVVKVSAGQGRAGAQLLDRALEDHLAARRPGTRAEVDDVVGDGDDLGLVLDDEHRVALVAQTQQQAVHPGDVVRMQPDRRLVEDVGDVGQRRAEVADHPGALRLAARQRARRPVEREIAEPDLDERVERVLEAREQGCDRRLVQAAQPLGEVVDLHRAGFGDVDPFDLRRASRLVEPGATAIRAGRERHGPLDEGADVRLERVDVLRQHRLLDPRDEPLERQVDALDLDLGRLLVEQVVELLRGEVADRLVHVEAGAGEDAAVPAVHAVAGDLERATAERLRVVVELGQVHVGDRAHALAARAHAAVVDRVADDDPLALALVDGHRAAGLALRDVERVGRGRTDMGLPEAAEQQAQQGIRVGRGPDRGADVGAHALLVHDDRRRQPLERVDVRPRQRRHETLHERAVGLVDHPLRLGRDRAEHQRALARAGDTGEHRQPALRDLDAHVLEVVHPGAVHADQVVLVGDVRRGRLPGDAHRGGSSMVVSSAASSRASSGPRPTSSWRKKTKASSPASRNGRSLAAQAATSAGG